MQTFALIKLIDGPLAPLDPEPVVKLMAAILIEKNAFYDKDDAKAALRGHFEMVEIVVNADNARQYAMQTVVAQVMSEPDGAHCHGGIDPGFDECPKCGATMDDDCGFAEKSAR